MNAAGRAAYTRIETLHVSARTVTARAVRQTDGRRVLLKMLTPSHSGEADVDRLKRELAIARQLDPATAVRPLALETFDGATTLVLEDFGGAPLARALGGPMAVDRFLRIAARVAAALADVHRQGVVHKDIKPTHVHLREEALEVKLADFGLAAALSREPRPEEPALPHGAARLEGTFQYMAPEQTGQMDRRVDHRADLYALGVTFYEMLTGQLPFQARDPVEWVHCHIARRPTPPEQIVPEIPDTVSRIVLKLLEKAPEDRYQSASGLALDLERCAAERRAHAGISPFALGERDVADGLEIPRRLYGREAELATLLDAYRRLRETGTPELVLVSGTSGVGKSALVRELGEAAARDGAMFLEGKFDQYRRKAPYSTVIQAFRAAIREILGQPEEPIAAWRERLSAALGRSGQLIVELIPQLELIVGPQPPVLEVAPTEAHHRFSLVSQQFVGAFATAERPVVLFLDDLQWADAASLALVDELVTSPRTRHLLFIGAYRTNEVGPEHQLRRVVARARAAGVPVRELPVHALSTGHLAELVASALKAPAQVAAPLARLVGEKTGGNPFFAIHFLCDLSHERLLELDHRTRAWRWDLDRIRAKALTDNVADLMVAKLRRLPEVAQATLRLAACLGVTSDVETLALVSARTEERVKEALSDAVREGLMLRAGRSYTFSHDRIQQAAYSLVPEEDRTATHLRIGRALLDGLSPQAREERVVEIVTQLNEGARSIEPPEERRETARLNLIAAKRAKASAAYEEATAHLECAISLLPADSWERDYELTYALHLERAECEFLRASFEESHRLIDVLLSHARTRVDREGAYRLRGYIHETKGEMDRAVATAIECLDLFGIRLAPHPSWDDVRAAYDEVLAALAGRDEADLLRLPDMTDVEMRAAMRTLSGLYALGFFTDINLTYLHAVHMVRITLRYGNTEASAHAYAWFGFTMAAGFHDYHGGVRFAKLALALAEQRGFVYYKARTLEVLEILSFWSAPVDVMLGYMREAFTAALEIGDMPLAAYCCNHIITDLLAKGERLDDVHREIERRLEFVRRTKFTDIELILLGQERFVENMRGRTAHFASFSGERFSEEAFDAAYRKSSMQTMVCWNHIIRLQARFMSGDYDAALRAAAEAEPLLWASAAHVQLRDFHLYRALTLAAAATNGRRDAALPTLESTEARFRRWAELYPTNFCDQHALIAAEIARLEGREIDAERLYEQAIEAARAAGFIHHEGLAQELCSRFYRARGLDAIADLYLRGAVYAYRRWGAEGKVQQLERAYPQVAPAPHPLSSTATFAGRPEQLDALSIAKASQTISGEIVHDRLVQTLIRTAIEEGGAQRGCLILRRGNALCVEAEAELSASGVEVTLVASLPVERSSLARVSAVNYAFHTKEAVIVEDGSRAGRLSAGASACDPSAPPAPLDRASPRSLVCLPIVRQGEVAGLFYLENDAVAGAFARDRLAIVEMLASQAAISLENARLLAREQLAREAAEAGARRAAFLDQASQILAESLDPEEVMKRLAQLSVRSLCDWCAFDLLEDGRFRRVTAAHRDPGKAAVVARLEAFAPAPCSAHPAAEVTRTGDALLVSDFTEPFLRGVVDGDEHLRLMAELGLGSAMVAPLRASGRPIGALTLVASTRRYEAADLSLLRELGHRAAIAIENARLYRRAQEAVRLREEFLSVASHELNTPVTSMLLALQTLEHYANRTMDPVTFDRILKIAGRQVRRLSGLVGELLDVTRIEKGDEPLALGEVDLAEVVRDVLARFAGDLAQAGCAATFSCDGPVVGRWDRPRLDRVVSNLLSNAVKFGARAPIEIAVSAEAGVARLTVKDHGIGIEHGRQARIFDRFERAVSAQHYGGLGLGLYICRRIVEAHEGSLTVSSRLGEGATFTVALALAGPRREAPRDPLDADLGAPSERSTPPPGDDRAPR